MTSIRPVLHHGNLGMTTMLRVQNSDSHSLKINTQRIKVMRLTNSIHGIDVGNAVLKALEGHGVELTLTRRIPPISDILIIPRDTQRILDDNVIGFLRLSTLISCQRGVIHQ